MSRLRVLQLVPDFSLGGAERLVAHLVANLDPDRFEVGAASLYDARGTDLDSALARTGRPIWYLGKKPGFAPSMFLRIDRVVRSFRPHVMHTHTISLRYALPSMLLHRIPARVHTIHSLADKEAGSWTWLRRFAFARGVVPVAIADEVKAGVARIYGIEDCPNIPNAIPIETYRTPRVPPAVWRQREGFRPDDLLLVTVGRLQRQKNQSLLIEAFRSVRTSNPAAHLLVVGEPAPAAVLDELEALTDRLDLRSSVHFLGPRSDIPDVLGAADVFALSSDFEGNPLTVMEAMAAGKPVVSTAVGGVPELVQDGVTGTLVPVADPAKLGAALLALLDSTETRRAMGQAGAVRAAERFDAKRMVRAYEDLYETLAAGRPMGPGRTAERPDRAS